MKRKWAIYQGKVGLYAVEYADTPELIADFPYINNDRLPVIINRNGGYTSFNYRYEKEERGFIKVVQCEEDEYPLTREEMFPKNSKDFEFGWIDLEGNSYNTGWEGHSLAAYILCKENNIDTFNPELELEERGWVKTTKSSHDPIMVVIVENGILTKKQADTLFDLGLWDVGFVRMFIEKSEPYW